MNTSTGVDRARDEELLRRLHDEHAVPLWRYVIGLVGGDDATAQDVVQETFLRAWRHPEVLGGAAGSHRAWLCTVARNIVTDQHRWRARRPEQLTAAVPDAIPVAADQTQQLVDRHIVLAALRELSPQHRDVLVECYFRGSSVAQAAVRLGIAEGTVKSRTHYALHALRRALEEQGGAS